MSLPPLAAIRCFEAAARHGNFTRAAEELGMTQAAVSYQIKVLEDRMGALFVRKARTVALTETGARLAPAVTAAFAALRMAFADVDPQTNSVLSISAANTFATNWLVPRLGRFRAAHPEITVKLDLTPRLIDFASGEGDVGIRSGVGPWPGLGAHFLLPLHYTAMLGPGLVARLGAPSTPADLLRYPLIEPDDPWWVDWFASAGVSMPDLSRVPGVHLGTQQLGASLAQAGEGVAILSPALFGEELASGRLLQPFPLVHTSAASYWLVHAQARQNAPKIRAFREWLLTMLAREGHHPPP
jgi:LysR family transcriptional regulator, glycine cleavage system transcriptional activator